MRCQITIINNYGILVIMISYQELPAVIFFPAGRFSFPSFLLKLVAGVGLLTLTATIVDLAALYFLPDRFKYRQYVYEESPLIRKKMKEQKGKTE